MRVGINRFSFFGSIDFQQRRDQLGCMLPVLPQTFGEHLKDLSRGVWAKIKLQRLLGA